VRPLHQDRHHWHPIVEGALHLAAHRVLRILQPSLSRLVARLEPPAADDNERGGRALDGLLDGLGKIIAPLQRVDVLEDVLLAVAFRQSLVDAATGAHAVGAAVGEEEVASLLGPAAPTTGLTRPGCWSAGRCGAPTPWGRDPGGKLGE